MEGRDSIASTRITRISNLSSSNKKEDQTVSYWVYNNKIQSRLEAQQQQKYLEQQQQFQQQQQQHQLQLQLQQHHHLQQDEQNEIRKNRAPFLLSSDGEEQSLQCPYVGCSVKFQRREHLRRHLKIHTGIKAFACSLCQKTFIRSDNLKQHLQVHNKVKVVVRRKRNMKIRWTHLADSHFQSEPSEHFQSNTFKHFQTGPIEPAPDLIPPLHLQPKRSDIYQLLN